MPSSNKCSSYWPKFKLSTPFPSTPFCWQVMRQQMAYSFSCVVLNLCIVSVCASLSLEKNYKYWCRNLNLGSAFYVDKQLMLLFTCITPTHLIKPLSSPKFYISALGANSKIYGLEIFCCSSEKNLLRTYM